MLTRDTDQNNSLYRSNEVICWLKPQEVVATEIFLMGPKSCRWELYRKFLETFVQTQWLLGLCSSVRATRSIEGQAPPRLSQESRRSDLSAPYQLRWRKVAIPDKTRTLSCTRLSKKRYFVSLQTLLTSPFRVTTDQRYLYCESWYWLFHLQMKTHLEDKWLLLWGQLKRVGVVQTGDEKALGRPSCGLFILEKGRQGLLW